MLPPKRARFMLAPTAWLINLRTDSSLFSSSDILMANQTEGKRKHDHRLDQISLWITFLVKCMDLAFPCSYI